MGHTINKFQSTIINLIVIIILVGQYSHFIVAFNLDTVNYVRHRGQPNSMFGFSIALHQEHQRSWVIVGAPKDDTSTFQPGVIEGGNVYRCDIIEDDRCQMIPFDSKGNQVNERNEAIDTKSRQWFGATVSSSGVDGPIVACAPRYVFHTLQPKKVERVEPVGTCYLAKDNFRTYTEYSPCRTMFWGYHRQGSCQAGLSAALTKKGDRLFIGAPGSFYWQGQEYSINTDAAYPYKPPRYGKFGEGGQTYSHNLNNPRDKVYATDESTAVEDDSYLGYSTATGDFNGDGLEGVAIGMPRGGGLLGKVLLFSWNMTNQQNITGEQIGAYFGYSLAVVDVDGDKLQDLIIGAPMHTEPNNEGKYEMGRVYIFYQEKYEKFRYPHRRDGENSRARFGLSLTSLNDINMDGYGDFAVGAPYDGPEGRGAVYIYHGSPKGTLEKYSQVIFPESLSGSTTVSTFGFSVSGGVDLDGNMYPDMAVGSYESDAVFIFKSRPVAVMEASTVFETETKLVSLDNKNCTVGRDRKAVTCTSINSCLKYYGLNLPSTIDIEVSWVLDAKKPRNPRMFFLLDEGKNVRNSTMRLYRGKSECRREQVYIADGIRDKLTALEVEMKFDLRSNQPNQPVVTRRRRAVLEPVLDQNRGLVQRDSINIQKNCGRDNICIPDLRMKVEALDQYLHESRVPLKFNVLISNYGEDAFEAGFFMNIPQGLSFKKIEQIGDGRDIPITCTSPSPATNYTLKCDVGNPLPSGKVVHFDVIMQPARKHALAPSYDFYLEANSTNPEVDGSTFDNIYQKNVGIWVKSDLSIKGQSFDSEVLYNATEYLDMSNATKEADIGPEVVHVYDLTNVGPSTIFESEIFLLWPYATTDGDALMYLLSQPETFGNIKCNPTPFANPNNLKLDPVLARKSHLKSRVSIMGAAESETSNRRRIGVTTQQASATGQSGSSTHVITAEERLKLDKEEHAESVGDASFDNRQRAEEAARANAQGYHEHSYFESQGQGGAAGQSQGQSQGQGFHASSNRTITIGSDGRRTVVESSTEYYTGGVNPASHSAYSVRQSAGQSSTGQLNRNAATSADIYRQNTGQYGQVGQDISHLSSRTQSTGSSSNESHHGRTRMKSQQDGEPFRPGLITGAVQLDKSGTFQAATLDLGTLQNRDNADRQLHGQTSHRQYQSGSGSYGQQSSGSSGYNRHQSHGGVTATNQEEVYDDNYDGDLDTDYYAGSTHDDAAPTQQTGTNINDDKRFKLYPRFRRQTDFNEEELNRALTCNRTKCAMISCIAGPLITNHSTYIAIRTRLVAHTLRLIAPNIPANLSTMVVSRITKLPYIGRPKEMPIKTHEVGVTAIPTPEPKPDVIPLWVVVLSAVAGVIILLLLIYLLYKCGFFKRNRPTDSQERQPLNRNGNYNGDERL